METVQGRLKTVEKNKKFIKIRKITKEVDFF